MWLVLLAINVVLSVAKTQEACVVRNTATIKASSLPCFDELMNTIVLEAVDIRPYNILVSREDPTKIMAVIDWEGAQTSPIWNVKPTFFANIFVGYEELQQEAADLERLIWDEVAHRAPWWAEAVAHGKSLRNIVTLARWSDWDPIDCDFE
jgi:hypothetical protein